MLTPQVGLLKVPFFPGSFVIRFSKLLKAAVEDLKAKGCDRLIIDLHGCGEGTLSVPRIPRVMAIYQFLLGMVLALYVGFSRLNHLRFVAHDAMLTGILKVAELPPQCTFWRFLASLHLGVGRQLLVVQQRMRERVSSKKNVN
jgi:hypothetical protein